MGQDAPSTGAHSASKRARRGGAIGRFQVHIGQVAEWFHQSSGQFNRTLIVVGGHPEVLGANADRDGALE